MYTTDQKYIFVQCTSTYSTSKKLDTPTNSRVFLYFHYFLHCRLIVNTSNYEITHMESCSNRKGVKQIKIYLKFEILQTATLCRYDSFAHSWYSLNQLHLECFSNSLEGVPINAEHLLAAFPSPCGPTHPKPSQLSWGGGLWRPGHLMQHSITLLLGKIALTQPGGVLGHCPFHKQMIVPRSTNQMGWRIAAECFGSHAG